MTIDHQALRECRQAVEAIGSAAFKLGLHMNDLPCVDEIEAALQELEDAKDAIVEALDDAEADEDDAEAEREEDEGDDDGDGDF